MTVMSEGFPLNSKYIKMGREEMGFSSLPRSATSCNCLPCSLIIYVKPTYSLPICVTDMHSLT